MITPPLYLFPSCGDDWDAHHREHDRLTVLAAARMMKKYLDEIVEAPDVPSQ